jgi:taurine--2-oxoglutarate transaminase
MVAAMKAACDKLIFAHPGAATEIRAKLSKMLADLMPGDLNTFFYTLGGAEANENAIRAARLFTGRQKIVSRYRSYHGGTNATLQLTGDPRRWANEPGMPGVVRVMDPRPYSYSFGQDDEEVVAHNLQYLEEVLQYEGPHTIAAMIIESVTGTNGVLAPPKGYLEGLRALLDKYGILLICDEVMAGFGRTGKLMGFMHADIVPDIVTMAKGLTSSYVPLGAMAVRDKIAHHFRDNVFWGGLTYQAHPFALECAYAAVNILLDEGMMDNAARLQHVMRREMDRLAARHPSVREGRAIGLFGMIDVRKNSKGDFISPYNGSHPAMAALGKYFKNNGLYAIVRWSSIMCSPPLCITEEQLLEGFHIIDKGLEITDEVFDAG